MDNNKWSIWAEQLRAIAQNGITYSKNGFDLERFHQLQVIAHEMTAQLADAPREKVDDFFLPEKGYATPKIDLRAGVFKQSRILLVKEKEDGRWSLPGGWADVCEAPSIGAEREVLEESGYEVKAVKLAAVRDTLQHPYHPKNPHHLIKLLFLCELKGGCPTENLEISEINFFPVEKLPPLSRGRTIKEDIQLLSKHLDNPGLPTEYD
ncbi:NUDIX hydrolase [Endozoicomonas sp. Mp262]|uniref:NUDIX hydrolase n=1 Tax=Endozoicomonas sp. Mp262 TaxID=2919499 RepID=UPI0021D856B3